MRSTAEVLDHHLKCFAARDIDGGLADYSEDTAFFGLEGALRGPNAIKPVFENMFAEFAKPVRTPLRSVAAFGQVPTPVYNPNWIGVKVEHRSQDWRVSACNGGPGVQSDKL